MTGYAELLEFLDTLDEDALAPYSGKAEVVDLFDRATAATSDFYIAHTATDGIPYWDTGAPGLKELGDVYARASEPENDIEPVDSSAAAIGAQALIRYGRWLAGRGREGARTYSQAGLTVLSTLLGPAYLCSDPDHQGLVLHSQYHRPNGWDHVQPGRRNPSGEATMWGDYHMRELALIVHRLARAEPYPTFFAI
jgi:unsaturated chondroitin disaccharide hydrolase